MNFDDGGLDDLFKQVTNDIRNKWAPAMTAESKRLVGKPIEEVKVGLDRVSRAHGIDPTRDDLHEWGKDIAAGTWVKFKVN